MYSFFFMDILEVKIKCIVYVMLYQMFIRIIYRKCMCGHIICLFHPYLFKLA